MPKGGVCDFILEMSKNGKLVSWIKQEWETISYNLYHIPIRFAFDDKRATCIVSESSDLTLLLQWQHEEPLHSTPSYLNKFSI